MIRIPIKNGDIDGALDKFATAKKEQGRKFDEQVSAFFAPKADGALTAESAPKAESAPEVKKPAKAPSYQSILARSRRMG